MTRQIIVHNLNALRWICDKQIFITNILKYSEETVNFLTKNNIPFTITN